MMQGIVSFSPDSTTANLGELSFPRFVPAPRGKTSNGAMSYVFGFPSSCKLNILDFCSLSQLSSPPVFIPCLPKSTRQV